MYKFIAIDIDGTLLNSQSELTEKTKEVLKKASEQGIYIVLTSGRLTNSVKKFCEEIGAVKYLIAENGASIINLHTFINNVPTVSRMLLGNVGKRNTNFS